MECGFKSHLPHHVAASIISLAATFLQKSPARSFRCVSSFAKTHARLACSVVNALTTARCRYQSFAGYEGSTPTAEMPKISFSCGSHKKSTTLEELNPCVVLFTLYLEAMGYKLAAIMPYLEVISLLREKEKGAQLA